MIPVRQTRFVDTDEKGRGNCFSACLASILELPIESVIDSASDEVRQSDDWVGCINAWLEKYNNTKLSIVVDPESTKLKGIYSIGSGPSPRGNFQHSVVCKNGVMVFDPHPSDDGVTQLKFHFIFKKLDPK